ncbi:MAG: FAD-binding oxidoreductase [Anaerolineales bacterium]|nr:FAD-binding oxidoreductase [Chloroflexota bacterium]MBL6981509.1 FAD-binding oxidoreductase [Anaerolineales bacterium]
MSFPDTANIVIIGGGVMGASTAYHLAARGVKDILLLEKDEFFGTGATGRCAGGVRYQFSTEVNIRLSLASLPMLERFEDEFGQAIDYRQLGYLMLLTNEKDIKTFRHNVELQHSLGVMTEWLDQAEVRRRVPVLNSDDVIAATNYPKDGVVDPNGVVMGYISAAQGLGVKAINEVAVTGINIENGKITGVQTSAGKVSTPVVVNAAGPWASVIGQMAGIPIPVTPLRRQWLTTTPLPDLSPDFPFVIDFAQSLYFHPEGKGLLTGKSSPNEQPGFSQNVDMEWELVHLEAAIKRLPLLEKAGLASRVAGLYENTPDAHPIYGETHIEGFFIVTGFSGHGFMHGPISGLLMAEIILDGKSSTVDVSMLDLARFDEGRLIHEYNVI